jgi:hypothetical protein
MISRSRDKPPGLIGYASWQESDADRNASSLSNTDMASRISTKRRKRVITFFNALSDLHEGDLHAVLDLDRCTPLCGEPDSLEDRARTGEALGRIMESHLHTILGFGECCLPWYSGPHRIRLTAIAQRAPAPISALGGWRYWAAIAAERYLRT